MKKVGVVWLVFVLVFSMGVVAQNAGDDDVVKSMPNNEIQYTPHAPILIDSIDDWAAYCLPGSGTTVDPYLIKGFEIDGSSYCIKIVGPLDDPYALGYFVIRDNYLHDSTGTGIYISTSWGKIVNNTIKYHTSNGISLFESEISAVDNNIISRCSSGINIWGTYGLSVGYNNINNCTNCIIGTFAGSANIHHNTIDNTSSYGISLGSDVGLSIENNVVKQNAYGIAIIGYENAYISSNNFFYNGRGISVSASNFVTISENTMKYNDIATYTANCTPWYDITPILTLNDNSISYNNVGGIYSENVAHQEIRDNIIQNNANGIELVSCSNQDIYHNNIINNMVQAYDDGTNFWDNDYPSGGNYWSDFDEPGEGAFDDFSGPLQDVACSDGIVDSPYLNIQGGAGAQDNYPLMHPWGWVDDQPPDHSNESPPIDGYSAVLDPIISVHVIDLSGLNTSTIRLYINGFPIFYDLTPIPNGYNVSYWHETGFSPDEVVTCRIKAEDMLGNLLDFTWQFTNPSLFEIDLDAGWNLVSFPLVQFNNSILHILSSIDGYWDLVQYYDARFAFPETISVANETVFGPANGTEIGPFYLANTNIKDLTLYSNHEGLLTEGIDYTIDWATGMIDIDIGLSMMEVGEILTAHYNYTQPADPWKSYSTNVSLCDLQELDNKMGFWLHTTQACTLSVLGIAPTSTEIQLHAGWNMVSYASMNQETVANALWGTGADKVEVCNTSHPYNLEEVEPTYMMKPGEGYWVHVTADTIWTVE